MPASPLQTANTPIPQTVTGAAGFLDSTIFYGLILLLVFTAIPYGTVDAWSIAIFEVAFFLLTLLWTVHAIITGSWASRSLRLFYPLFALAGVAILQSLSWSQTEVAGLKVTKAISADPYESWSFALRMIALTLAAILAGRFTKSSARLNVLVHTIIVVALMSGVFGMVRQTMQRDTGFVLPNLANGGGYGQFINKNHFAFLVEPAIGLLLGLTLLRRDRRERWLVYLALMILLWVTVVLSRSRGGVLALTVETIAAAAFFIHFRRPAKQKRHWARTIAVAGLTSIALVVVIVVGMTWLGGDQLQTGIETATVELGAAQSNEGARRMDIWRTTWRMARAHPIAGAGLGGFWAEFPLHHNASGAQVPKQAHNDYLELLASAGVIGVAIFGWFLFELFRRTCSAISEFHGFQRGVALGAVVGILGVAVHSLFDFGLHITVNALATMMLLGILNGKVIDQRVAAQAHRNRAFNRLGRRED